jgi:hypothetical protein
MSWQERFAKVTTAIDAARHPSESSQTDTVEFTLVFHELCAVEREIGRHLDGNQQNIQWLLTSVAAIGASTGLISKFGSFSDYLFVHPWVLLALALVSLWFPINNVTTWADLAIAARYANEVLIPKLNAMASAGKVKRVPPFTEVTGAVARYPGALSWEQYRYTEFVGNKRVTVLMNPLWWARSALFYVPFALLVGLYYAARASGASSSPSFAEWVLIAVIAAALVQGFVALVTLGNSNHASGLRRPASTV